MYHRVAHWRPLKHTDPTELTPGRIGSVSFFPKESFNQLKTRPAGWGARTAYGRWEEFANQK